MATAKLLSQRSHQVPGKLKIGELFFEVPRDHSDPSKGTLRLFARSAEKWETPVVPSNEVKQLPWLLYLQGGPGFGCRSPQNSGWVPLALDKGYKVLVLDQRGTGLSSTITAETLASIGNASNQAQYLKLFRADSIVKDCEAIRRAVTTDYPEDQRKWSILGQSFGGFCALNYLSRSPGGLREVFLTGGLPPLVSHPDLVYKHLFIKVMERSCAYYEKYIEDVARVKEIASHIEKEQISLPSGGKLTVSRLRQLGHAFGGHGGLDSVHGLICRMSADMEQFGFFTRPTLDDFESRFSFDTHPIYAILHEPIYARGSAPRWSADRVIKDYPQFALPGPDDLRRPILFTGEMIFRDMFDDYDELSKMKETADLLANDDDWPELYDEEQLAKNEVPVYSVTYMDDMYVHFDLARETAAKIKGCKIYVTNSLYHSALGTNTAEVVKQLFVLRDDTID